MWRGGGKSERGWPPLLLKRWIIPFTCGLCLAFKREKVDGGTQGTTAPIHKSPRLRAIRYVLQLQLRYVKNKAITRDSQCAKSEQRTWSIVLCFGCCSFVTTSSVNDYCCAFCTRRVLISVVKREKKRGEEEYCAIFKVDCALWVTQLLFAATAAVY